MLKSIRNSFILTAAVHILLGIVLIVFPGTSLKLVSAAIGIAVLIYGVVRFVNYMKLERDSGMTLNLLIGILLVIFGIFLLFSPQFIINILPVVLGVYIAVEGLIEMKHAFGLRKAGYSRWVLAFVISLVITVFGAVILFNPFATMRLTVIFIGVSLIVDGVSALFNAVSE